MLRRGILARRAEVTPNAAEAAADALAEALPHHALIKDLEPGPILVPTRHRTEIDTTPVARALEKLGWTIVRPRTHPDDNELEPVPWPTNGTLVAGRWGVPEPPPHAATMPARELVALLVPGVAFDANGGRLGMGSGVIDRFLPRARQADTPPPVIGIGYRFQLVDHVPVDQHDARIDGVQVEARGLTCTQA